jgi:hypothetical protein
LTAGSGATVLSVDISPIIVERLKARARQEEFNLEARVNDLENDTFDMGGSEFGVMLLSETLAAAESKFATNVMTGRSMDLPQSVKHGLEETLIGICLGEGGSRLPVLRSERGDAMLPHSG